jgi:hypothetical protein
VTIQFITAMLTSTVYDPKVATLCVNRDNGQTLNVYFEPVYSPAKQDNIDASVFTLYKSDKNGDNIFNHLSIPGEIGDNIPGLDAINKKDYLGELTLLNGNEWKYSGESLSEKEQEQVASYMKSALNN